LRGHNPALIGQRFLNRHPSKLKHFINRRTAAMLDAKDLIETESSPTATQEEAESGTSQMSGAAHSDAGAAVAANIEAPGMANNESAHDLAEAGAHSEAPMEVVAEIPARGESVEVSSSNGALGASDVASRRSDANEDAARTPPLEAPRVEPPRVTLIPFVAPKPKSSPFGALGRFASDRRFQTGAAAACLALVAIAAGGATLQTRSQDESQRLAALITTLSARLDAVEAAKPRDEAADIRKAVVEARGGLASSRDLSATVAQLNARLDRVEHEQQARLDKIGDRLEHDVAARNADTQARGADLSARIDKFEKADIATRLDRLEKADVVGRIDKIEKADVASRIDKVEKKMQTAAAQPAAAPLPPQKEAAAGPGVSNEVTGSIEKPHPSEPIRGWYLVEMRNGSAVVDNRQRAYQIAPGDVLPGAGKVERFERRGHDWVVVTDQGVITQAPPQSYAPRVVLRPPMYGPYGGFGPGYGGYED
jgi:hypothetical protein